MNFFNKITLKNIAKSSSMSFLYGIFPLITLMLFYSPSVSILGLLFSYISILGIVIAMNSLILIKNKFFDISELVSKKINEIANKRTSNIVKNSLKIIALLISVIIVYATLSVGSLFLNLISLISVLNPLMIVALNIYYVSMALVFTGYNN